MITPVTTLKLMNVPMDPGQDNQVDFTGVNAQLAWMSGRVLKTYANFTYQKKDLTVCVPEGADVLWNVNYCAYQNDVFPGKWFYAFVTKIEYVSDEVTRLTLETDVFQTWQFNYTILPSFVEREHEDEGT
jgi:hypothetical protein